MSQLYLFLTTKKITDEINPAATRLEVGELQRAIFNSANFSIITTDAKGVIQFFNVGVERTLGYTAAEVMNKLTQTDLVMSSLHQPPFFHQDMGKVKRERTHEH